MAKKAANVPHKWFPNWRHAQSYISLGVLFENIPVISEGLAVSKHAAFVGDCHVGQVTLTRVCVGEHIKYVVPAEANLKDKVAISLLAEKAILTELQLKEIDVEREAAAAALAANKAEVTKFSRQYNNIVSDRLKRSGRALARLQTAELNDEVPDEQVLILRHRYFKAKKLADRAPALQKKYWVKARELEKIPL